MRYILKALSQTYLDLSFQTGGMKVEIVEFPGRWMGEAALARLGQDLRSIAGKTLPAGDLTYGVFSGDIARLSQTIITLVRDRDGAPIAFNALAVIPTELNGRPTDVLHLGLVMVDPDQRSKGLSWILYGLTCLLLLLRAGLRPLYVSNVTQVPAVVGLVSETFSGVYPTPGATKNADFNKLLLARAIMAGHRHVFGVGADADFDEARFVITNAYTGGSDHLKKTFLDAPKHRIETYNDFCRDQLDYDRGDDVLQIGQIDLAAARSYVTKQVPRGSILSLLALGALVLLRRLVLPVIQWTDSGKDHGLLRPAK